MRAIVTGAGFAGAVIAERLAAAGWNVDLYEKRNHIAGNMFDEVDENGVLCHRYGPHVFRTDDDAAWSYLSGFGAWYEFVCRTAARIDGADVYMPFNVNAVERLLGVEKAQDLARTLNRRYGVGAEIPVLELLRSDEPLLVEVAQYFYEKDYAPYTQKQWGKGPKEIDPSVTARVPFRNSRDDRLFRAKHQYLPAGGYTRLFEALLEHPRIHVHLGVDVLDFVRVDEEDGRVFVRNQAYGAPFVFTGAVDDLLHGRFGRLPYRSLAFESVTRREDYAQPCLGVCYPDPALAYTRIVEYKHLMQENPNPGVTTLIREYPLPYHPLAKRGNIPYYPMMTEEAAAQYERYRSALGSVSNLYLVGRLAEYRYYNMDQVILRALEMAEKILRQEGADQ